MPTVDLPIGPVDYRTVGPTAAGTPVAVFVHGFLVNATLWDPVAEQLAADGVRCLLPDWPLGAHRRPAKPHADLSPNAVADAVVGLLDALELREVILVGNDTGGGLCQLALRRATDRVRGLVLTNCDGFEQFPPRYFVPLFILARSRPAVAEVIPLDDTGGRRRPGVVSGGAARTPGRRRRRDGARGARPAAPGAR